ncbi:Uncharacterised protein [Enterobacter hormaechei]|uniref:DUF3226 domain-containing protein n=1 Tax=Enterobacter hormaechei TaxID=158836 RepID=UPI0007922A27|nr:DUF3226 domain-containing protein [Enterobacter hormaechei]MCM7446716.1 hypothetical protein [Enterobacter hormaechei]CZY47156.1 Uncharacterised protein [Enterobacter hormaechei]
MGAFSNTAPRMLLAEGKNDCHVITALCGKHNLPENFVVHDCESDNRALKKLSALISSSENFEIIGVVIDADNPNLRAKWENISARLQKEGYSVPHEPSPNGTIMVADGKPKIGVWLMPDNLVDGMLENFCASMISVDAVSFARQCVENAQRNGYSTFIDNHFTKATIHTFLSWQNIPGMPLGQAITANVLDGEHEIALRFVNFIRSLFNE